MIHINEDGELVEVGGTLFEMGADTSCMLTVASVSIIENGGDREEVADYVRTILETAIDTVKGEEIKEGIKEACRIVGEYEIGSKRNFVVYRDNGSLTGIGS